MWICSEAVNIYSVVAQFNLYSAPTYPSDEMTSAFCKGELGAGSIALQGKNKKRKTLYSLIFS